MSEIKQSKSRGRPPAFNHEDALDKAMRLFWTYGYDGTSISALTEALGINKPSMYGAFGDKEELFRKSVNKYCSDVSAFIVESINEPTSYKVAKKFLTRAAELVTDTSHPLGCMLTQSALTCSPQSEVVRGVLSSCRQTYECALQNRFSQALADHDLPADADPVALSKLLATLHQGMSVQASGGASKEDLLRIVNPVLAAWPVIKTDLPCTPEFKQ